MKKIVKVLVVVIMLCGCSNQPSVFKDEFLNTIEDLNQKHSKFKQIDVDFTPYIEMDRGKDMSHHEFAERVFGDQEKVPDALLKEAAIEDIEFYFKALKHYYGGYLYFGGDERFNQAKTECLNYVNQVGQQIDTKQLNLLLLSQLNFVKDNHFTINNKRSNPAAKYFSNEFIEFIKIDNSYYNKSTKRKVMNVDEDVHLDSYFHYSINPEGELTYYFGLVLKHLPKISYQLLYEDGTREEISVSATFSVKKSEYFEDFDSDIATVQIGSMFHEYGDSYEVANQFLKSAITLKAEDVAILDLRNNSGGNGLLPYKWIKNYVNTNVFLNSKGIMIYDGDIHDNQVIEGFNTQKMSEISDSILLMPLNDQGVYKKNDGYNQFISSKTILFVLMNTNSASATEYLIDLLHNVKNVIFVGTNSAGCLISDVGNAFSLPHSKFKVVFGNSISMIDEKYYQEFRGFEPDLWLNNEDMDNLIKKYIYRNLNKTMFNSENIESDHMSD